MQANSLPAEPPGNLKLDSGGHCRTLNILAMTELYANMSIWGVSLIAQMVKNLPAVQETSVQSLGWEDPLEKGTATHSGILAWRIPWTIRSMGSPRVRHSEQLTLSLFLLC